MKNLGIHVVLVTMLVVSGCSLVSRPGKVPINAVSAVIPGQKRDGPDPAVVQTELQRYSDEYMGRTVAALDEYSRIVGPTEEWDKALVWKMSVCSSIVGIVSGPNPAANLVDFLALTTLTRIALEDRSTNAPQGQALQPWLEASRDLEIGAWKLGQKFLTPTQLQELRQHIQQWWQANPNVRHAFFARPQEISAHVRQTGGSAQSGSVFSLVGLDPTAGLDPAVREVTRTRLFAERAMYTAQRMPLVVRWQIELLTGQLLHDPQVELAMTNASLLSQSADRLSRASESVSQTAAQLPEKFTAERQAILGALEAQQGPLRELSAEISRTLSAGDKMSVSLNMAIATFDGLMKRFGIGKPAREPRATNTPPFNILDYARTADQLALMARELDVLLKDAGSTLDSPAIKQRTEDLAALVEHARANATSILNYAFLLGALLVLLVFVCAVLYQWLKQRMARVSFRPPSYSNSP